MPGNAIEIGGVDLTDADTYLAAMPYDAFRELRHRAPVAWHPHGDTAGFWALTRHEDIYAVSRDSDTWSSQAQGVFVDVPEPEDAYQLELMMLTMDPPRHTQLRSLVSRGFTPRHVARLNHRTEDMARDILDEALERGECEFVGDVAGALPSYVIAELLGIPLADGRALYALTEIMNTRPLHDPELVRAQTDLFGYANELAARKRANPGDDIATALLHAEVDGQRLTDLEFDLFFMLLLNAGGDTTRNLVAAGTLALIEHPEQWARLAADPSLMPTAIEEMLRWTSPVTVFTRTATRDTRIRDIPVRRGERVAMFYPSANRDEDHFAEADRFDVGRTPNHHLAFGGGGTHFCLGASLARAEATAIFREIITRTSAIELAGPVERVRSVLMNGIHSMPVRLVPAAVAA
ncbi:cytochrome P450 [Mycolicibacterium iranicum]|uniref:Steroid C26-monooxygenase n=1 Tax=Mycolicibacterium iranicum TaxID=912594 RepID=A0A839PXK5_MYCIR|nr:cytochrome P450 [Mycolicibacterium iranicum]MBB2988790.1 cytochrome P450 [Mycolicibacterium iranicum]